MKITKLTDNDRVLMAQVREEWLSRFFSAEPIDRTIAKEGIDWIYKLAKMEPPRIIFVDSPLTAQKAANWISQEEWKVISKPATTGVLSIETFKNSKLYI